MKWRSAWPIFHGPVILPYIVKTIWCMNIIFWDYESVWPDVWPPNKCRSLWFCLISWRLFDIWTSYFGIISQYDPLFDLKMNVCHCDLYFTVQWFYLISWRLFDVCTSYFGIRVSMTRHLTSNICRSLWHIFHRPLNLPYILTTVWCMNIILCDNDSM